MKTIYIKEQFKEDWNRVLNHIANLFYEDSVIQAEVAGADMQFSFTHRIDKDFTIYTSAKLEVEGQVYTNDYHIGYKTEGTEKEQNIRLKRALSHVMLDVLEQYSGMTQQWGILTGVRPTKLYHKLRKEGKSEEEIARVLHEDFRISHEKIALLKAIVER